MPNILANSAGTETIFFEVTLIIMHNLIGHAYLNVNGGLGGKEIFDQPSHCLAVTVAYDGGCYYFENPEILTEANEGN
jgi:hypothetical protein